MISAQVCKRLFNQNLWKSPLPISSIQNTYRGISRTYRQRQIQKVEASASDDVPSHVFAQDFCLQEKLQSAGSIGLLADEIRENKDKLDIQLWLQCLTLLKRFHQANPQAVQECLIDVWIPMGLQHLKVLQYTDLHNFLTVLPQVGLTTARHIHVYNFLSGICSQPCMLYIPKQLQSAAIVEIYLNSMEAIARILSYQIDLSSPAEPSKSVIAFLQVCYSQLIFNIDSIKSLDQLVQALRIEPRLINSQIMPELQNFLRIVAGVGIEISSVSELHKLAEFVYTETMGNETNLLMLRLIQTLLPKEEQGNFYYSKSTNRQYVVDFLNKIEKPVDVQS